VGLRGPKKGWKKAAAAPAAAASVVPAKKAKAKPKAATAPARKRVSRQADKAPKQQANVVALMPVAHRENPEKLEGDALKALAHRRGMPKSELEKMPDAKIREQLKYLAYRQYHDEAA
jgi:hypothetical protein